ncbi:hypothetical protein VKT23_002837 [Stygiomarasmius scandens]|uniref:TATA-binding protein interacting (TIP20) domain-containing protein n=1 Tax=Marasmiellus scandens TaxID=2682957 RepID=A0ABR1JX74_9AGAR
MTKTYQMNSLVEKMQSPDQDFRFMGLNDLMTEIKADPNCFLGDETVENKVLNQVLSLVEDKISEVKNQAVKCLAQLIKILRPGQMEIVVDKLIDFSGGKDEELRDISALALKTITAELPPDGKVAASACAKLAPKLLGQIENASTPPEALVETLSILSILISRFPAHLSTSNLPTPPLVVLAPLLSHPRPVVRKRAIVTISQFIPISQPALFDELLKLHVFPHLDPSANVDKQRTTVQLLAAVAKNSSPQIAPVLGEIVPGILKAVQRDDDELRESCLQTLEALLLRCPMEISPYISMVIQVGNQFIKYDPNYAGDDEDEEMADVDDEDDEDAELDEYSDDEDTSYKIRRSATKLHAALIGTRPEQLSTIYKEISPVLISRFGDREQTVKVEVWSTYVTLLNQTALYGGLQNKDKEDITHGKRKRDTEESMDVEEGPFALLKSQVPTLSKALLNQLKSPKTPPATLQAGFTLLYSLLNVLPGCLASQTQQIISTAKSVLSQPPTTSTATLYLSTLSFLSLFFSTHSPPTFVSLLPSLTPSLLKSAGERHPKVAAESLRVFSSLLQSLKPIKPSSGFDWIEPLYNETLARLSTHDTDSEVRSSTEDLVADLWICAPEILKNKDKQEWTYICRPTTTGNTKVEGGIRVISRVAREPAVTSVIGDQWVNGCMDWLLGVLKNRGLTASASAPTSASGSGAGTGTSLRTGKVEVFTAIDTLLKAYTPPSSIPPGLPPTLIAQIKPFLSLSTSSLDISLLSQSLVTLSILLDVAPKLTFPEVEKSLLNEVYAVSCETTLGGGVVVDSLLGFYESLVRADPEIATHVVPGLVIVTQKTGAGGLGAAATTAVGSRGAGAGAGAATAVAGVGGGPNLGTVAKCVAQVVKTNQGVAAGVIAEYSKNLKPSSKAKPSMVILSLLIMGELGRFIDMSPQQEIFTYAIEHFSSSPSASTDQQNLAQEEQVRSAAAFAAGNIAIGNLHQFLPIIVKMVQGRGQGQDGANEKKKRLSSLYALKEVVTHCSHGQLEGVAETLWVPLFENSENAEETTRNVAAACLGKLATTHPGKYLPQLHARIKDENPSARATVVSAIRYTFAENVQSYDELLSPLLVDFLSLMTDPDLTVRRLALSALNSAARTKPHLLKDHLNVLLPYLYEETKLKSDLIRVVQMGPWQHKVDDGLEARKTAYETMYTLLDTCLPKLDLHEFLSRVLPGLSDDSDEIKVMSHMMLFRLSQVAPTAVSQRLDEATPLLQATMKGITVNKDTVKQDFERSAELQRSALRAVAALSRIGTGISARFDQFVEELKRNPTWGAEFKELVH